MKHLSPLLWLGLACGRTDPTPLAQEGRTPEHPVESPALMLRGVDFVDSRGSRVFAEGHLDAVDYDRQTGELLAQSVRVHFPRADQPGSAVDLTAPLARGNPIEERVSGEGGVHFRSQLGQSGDTEAAEYQGRQGTAEGRRPVELRGRGFVLNAPGFRWSATTDALEFEHAQLDSRDQPR